MSALLPGTGISTNPTDLAFFDKYKDEGEGIAFAIDFGRISAQLQSRLHKEEAILYVRYEEMAAREVV